MAFQTINQLTTLYDMITKGAIHNITAGGGLILRKGRSFQCLGPFGAQVGQSDSSGWFIGRYYRIHNITAGGGLILRKGRSFQCLGTIWSADGTIWQVWLIHWKILWHWLRVVLLANICCTDICPFIKVTSPEACSLLSVVFNCRSDVLRQNCKAL